MNLREQFNGGKVNFGFNNRKQTQFCLPSNPNIHSKRESTPSSKTNWGKSHQSVSNSSGVYSETSAIKEDARVILALSEGRGGARCEVGIAVINASQPHLVVCQISDTQSYDNTLRKVNIFNPTQILVPMTFVDSVTQSRLIEKVKEQFPHVIYTPVRRNTYNKASGMAYIQDFCVPSLNSVVLVIQHRYYALTAVSALLKFLQGNLNIFYACGSIKIDYQESEGYAIIDVCTADRLELVSSTKPLQATKYSTLFGVLNNCYTKIGERALRTLLLQPPFDTSIIMERQDCVTALMRRPEKLQAIQVLLQKLGSIDQLLILPTILIDDSQYYSTRQLNYMLYLNNLVDLISTFKDVVSDFEQPLFKNLSLTLNSKDFLTIKDTVRTLIHENAYSAKSHNGLLQRCFAIKPGINGLLDLIRKIYSERLDDMRGYVKSLGEKYDLPLTLGNNITKGYHIVFALNKHQRITMKKTDIPKEFIQVYRLAGSFTMKTMELINYQSRIDDLVKDILKISSVMIFKTLVSFKNYMGLFFKLCEDIANIDVIQSLAEVALRNNYVQPTFGSYTEVQDSRHPMLDMLACETPIPNLISSCEDYNVHIITGPNGSGKSIFIRQVILIQIMAQIGGYVPARSASFRSADRMFARVYFEDNMEYGASSFVLEMREITYILTHLTNNSLIIIDELARSTSLEEGAALAMAICEHLASSSAFVYLTSHFTLVTKLGELYLNVKNWHLDTDASGDAIRNVKLDFKYTLKDGITNLQKYGIFMVKDIWPQDIMEDIYALLEHKEGPKKDVRVQQVSRRNRLKYELESNLRKLQSNGKVEDSEVNKLVNQYYDQSETLNMNLDSHTENYTSEQNSFLSPPFAEDVSDEVLSAVADSIIPSPVLSQQMIRKEHYIERVGTNYSRESDSSSYKQLSRFIGEDTNNINLLHPEINISDLEDKSIESFEEEVNPINQSLVGALKNQQEKRGIQILSNVLLDPKRVDTVTNHMVGDNTWNLPDINTYDNIPMDFNSSQRTSKSSQDAVEMTGANRSLITEIQIATKNFTENNMEVGYRNDNITENDVETRNFQYSNYLNSYDVIQNFSQNAIQSTQIRDFEKNANLCSNDSQILYEHVQPLQEFHFLKPLDRPMKRHKLTRTQENCKKIINLEDKEQMRFSLPLLQNKERSSTPLVDRSVSFAQDPYLSARFTPNKSSNWNNDSNISAFSQEEEVSRIHEKNHIYPLVEILEGTNDRSVSFGTLEHDDNSKHSEDKYHIYPRVEIIEGPNDLSVSFGTEDEKRKSSISKGLGLYENECQVVSDENKFEKFVIQEMKILLSDSADLFDGDIDSLEITVENLRESEKTKPTTVSSFQQSKELESTRANTENILQYDLCSNEKSSKSSHSMSKVYEESEVSVYSDNEKSLELITQNSEFNINEKPKVLSITQNAAQINVELLESSTSQSSKIEELSGSRHDDRPKGSAINELLKVDETFNSPVKESAPPHQTMQILNHEEEKPTDIEKTDDLMRIQKPRDIMNIRMFENHSFDVDVFLNNDSTTPGMNIDNKCGTITGNSCDLMDIQAIPCKNFGTKLNSFFEEGEKSPDSKIKTDFDLYLSESSRRRNIEIHQNTSTTTDKENFLFENIAHNINSSPREKTKLSDDKNKSEIDTRLPEASLKINIEVYQITTTMDNKGNFSFEDTAQQINSSFGEKTKSSDGKNKSVFDASLSEASRKRNIDNQKSTLTKSDKRKFSFENAVQKMSTSSGEKTKSSDSKNEVDLYKSLSEASRRRNIDKSPASDSNSFENEEKITTSISEASRKRNLDNSSSDKSKSSEVNIPFNSSKSNLKRNLDISSTDEYIDAKRRLSEGTSSDSFTCERRKKNQIRVLRDTNSKISSDSLEQISTLDPEKNVCFGESRKRTHIDSNIIGTPEAVSRKFFHRGFPNEAVSKIDNDFADSKSDAYAEIGGNKNVESKVVLPLREINNYGVFSDDSNYQTAYDDDSMNIFEKSFGISKPDKPKKVLGYTKRAFSSNNVVKPKKSLSDSLKLTKREIQEEFDKQDRIIMQGDLDAETYTKYMEQRMNRPSVKQMQNAELLVTVRKTENGIEVIPPKKRNSKPRKYKNISYFEKSSAFDASIFSDQNAPKMTAYLASSEKSYNLFKYDSDENFLASQQGTNFYGKFVQKRGKSDFRRTQSFGESKFLDFTQINQSHSCMLGTSQNSLHFLKSQTSQNSSFFIPSGYFKENRKDIENICSKYLLLKTKTSPY